MPTLDFVEQAAIWTFAGLLAVSGTPLAAIAFLTVAPKFVIAMRTGNLGAIVHIYVDGIEAAVVDTHADTAGVIETILFGDPANETHQIYVQKDDDPDTIIEVIRKKLSAEEINPPGVRYNADDDSVQVFVDGEWIDAPAFDPRTSPGYLYPALTGSTRRCDAAANMVAAVKNIVDEVVATTTLIAMLGVLIAIITGVFPALLLLDPLILTFADAILFLTQTVVDAAFTSGVYDDLLCYFVVNCDDNGQLTGAKLETIRLQVTAEQDATVAAVFDAMVLMIGWVGFNNFGSQGVETGDCTDCIETCHIYNPMATPADYTNTNDGVTLFSTYDTGTFAGGKSLPLTSIRASWTSSGTGSLLTQSLTATLYSDVYPAGHVYSGSNLITNPNITLDTTGVGNVTRIVTRISTRWSGGGAYSVWGQQEFHYGAVETPFGWSRGTNCT